MARTRYAYIPVESGSHIKNPGDDRQFDRSPCKPHPAGVLMATIDGSEPRAHEWHEKNGRHAIPLTYLEARKWFGSEELRLARAVAHYSLYGKFPKEYSGWVS